MVENVTVHSIFSSGIPHASIIEGAEKCANLVCTSLVCVTVFLSTQTESDLSYYVFQVGHYDLTRMCLAPPTVIGFSMLFYRLQNLKSVALFSIILFSWE